MLHRRALYLSVGVAVVGLVLIGQAVSQESRPADRGNSGDSGQRQQRMEQFRQQMAARLKEALGATDEEWKVLQPKIEKVQTLARQARGGIDLRTLLRGRRSGDQPAEATDRQASDADKKMQDLVKVLQDKDSKPEAVKAALAAYREARTKAREELEKAQKELLEILTPRQEAQLVAWRVLD